MFATDHTNASRTLLFDIGRLRWDEELCALFNVPMRALPKCAKAARAFGGTEHEGILPEPLPICGVMGDSQASLFAQRCYEPGMAKATFGTGTSVLLNAGQSLRGRERSQQGHRVGTGLGCEQDNQPTPSKALSITRPPRLSWLKNQFELIDRRSGNRGAGPRR